MTQTVLPGNICDVRDGTHDSPKPKNSGHPLVTSKHIKNHKIDFSTANLISDEDFEAVNKRSKVDKHDILISMIGTVGELALIDYEPTFAIKNIGLIKTGDKLLGRYLFYYLQGAKAKRYIEASLAGSTQKFIGLGQLRKFPIDLPDLEAQKKIADILGTIDEKIELNRQMNETLEQMGRALFRHYFIDNPGAEKWESGILSDIIDVNPRESIKKGSVVTYLEMKNMPESGMSIKGAEARAFTSGMKFRNGDTLLARITPCLENGKTAFVDFLSKDEVGFGSTEYIVMRPKDTELTEYVYFLARSDAFRAHAIQSMVGTSGRQRVQNDSIVAYPVTKPASDLLAEFHEKMEVSFAQIRNNAQQIQTLTTLLPRLISGKVKV